MNTENFLDKKNKIAVVGVSSEPNKWGWKIYRKLKSRGFCVYPINPKYDKIDNDACYPDLKSVPEKPDVVITVVRPKITEAIAEQCKRLGIRRIWMQPGSESDRVIKFCKNNNIEVVYNACFVLGGAKADPGD